MGSKTDFKTEELRQFIRDIPDFPKQGILFKDITPLLSDADAFSACIDAFKQHATEKIDFVISIESRGFIFGSALAHALGAGFIPIRKEGKLPFDTHTASYELEYGRATVEIHSDALKPDSNVIIVDDVLATGGTAEAAIKLVNKFQANVCGVYFLIELLDLKGRQKLSDSPVHSLLTY